MLDLSQFEKDNPIWVGEPMSYLFNECLHLQENNRELVEFLKGLKNDYNYMFITQENTDKLDALLAKNQAAPKIIESMEE